MFHEYNILKMVCIFYQYKINLVGPTRLYGYRSCFVLFCFQIDK